MSNIKTMTARRYYTLILILGSLTAVMPLSIDMYLPGFPALSHSLHTPISKVALSLSAFFIGVSFGQLIYGPLFDRFGRKRPLYFGIILYIISSVSCMFVHSIEWLIVLRVLQALGSCAPLVAPNAIVPDLFPAKDFSKVFSLLILILGISPMIAPTIGGYITAVYGWQAIFLLLAIVATAVLILVVFVLPESRKPDPSYSLRPGALVRSFVAVAKVPQFYTYGLAGALCFSALAAYVSTSPFVFMELYGLDSKAYGWLSGFLSVGLIGASQLNFLLSKKFKSEGIVSVTIPLMFLISLFLYLGSLAGWLGMSATIALLFLFVCSVGITMPNTAGIALSAFTQNAGTAAALLGALQMGLSTLMPIAINLLPGRSQVPMAAAMTAAIALALLALYNGWRKLRETKGKTPKDHFIPSS